MEGHAAVVDALIAAGANVEAMESQKLLKAAKKGDLAGVRAAIEAGANLETKDKVR